MADKNLVGAIGAVSQKSETQATGAAGSALAAGGAQQPQVARNLSDDVKISDEALEDLQAVQTQQPALGGLQSNPQNPQPGMQVGGVSTTGEGFKSGLQPGMQTGGVYTTRDLH